MSVPTVGIAWYKREDYDTLKVLFADGYVLPDTYEEWLKTAKRVASQLRRDGVAVQKVYIDPKLFPAWCVKKGFVMDANARTRFSAEAVRNAASSP